MSEVLVVGGGGREQAIAQAIEWSDGVDRVEVCADARRGLEAFRGSKPLVVVGPEAPLVDGLADELRSEGYPVLGASAAFAAYEASKAETVKLARDAGVVHPSTFIAEGEHMAVPAMSYARAFNPDEWVVKADGLAGGKGVVLPETREEFVRAVEDMLQGAHGGAGAEIINFAKRKFGPEVSAMVLVGGGKDNFAVLPLSQDHKRLHDGDEGPNTGGMGAYAPVPSSIVNEKQYQKITEKAYKLLETLESKGVDCRGSVMYMGLMMSEDLQDDESDLLEINVRFGDPEAQVIFPLIRHAGIDVYRLLRSAAEGDLEAPDIDFSNIGFAALTVAMTAFGYPGKYRKGDVIYGLDREYPDVSVQLAGVRENAGGILETNGGRVLYVTGEGETVGTAADRAYGAIGGQAIHFTGSHYRKDIGWQAR